MTTTESTAAGALSAAIANLNCPCTDDDTCTAHQLLEEITEGGLAFYLVATCGNCDEDVHKGLCLSLLTHRGRPAVSIDMASQENFPCDNCGADNYTGDIELITEGGSDPDEDDEDESDD